MSKGWAWSISKEAMEKLINDNKSDELDLARLLDENGYSTILDGMEIDGQSWGHHVVINFSGLSLRRCNFINIKANRMLFIKADLYGAVINSSTRLLDVDFSQANMESAHIERPIEGRALFNDATVKDAILVSGEGLFDALTSQQYSQVIHIKIEPELYFSQDSIIKEYDGLSRLGVCNGLSIDFARHVVMNQKVSYIDKLKSMTVQHSEEFAQSITAYQEKLQTFDICAANEVAIKIREVEFLDALPDHLQSSNIIGFTVKGPLGAHIITIAKIDVGYIIFDPNMGGIDCTRQSYQKNREELNQQISNIYKMYCKKILAFGSMKVSDLEAVIREVGTDNISGHHVKKYNMSGLYFGLSALFCLVFVACFNLTEHINEVGAMLFSIATSFAISIYLAHTMSTFYKKHLSETTLEEL